MLASFFTYFLTAFSVASLGIRISKTRGCGFGQGHREPDPVPVPVRAKSPEDPKQMQRKRTGPKAP